MEGTAWVVFRRWKVGAGSCAIVGQVNLLCVW